MRLWVQELMTAQKFLDLRRAKPWRLPGQSMPARCAEHKTSARDLRQFFRLAGGRERVVLRRQNQRSTPQMGAAVKIAQKLQPCRQRFGPRRLFRRRRADRGAKGFDAGIGVAQKIFMHRPQGRGFGAAAPLRVEPETRKGADRDQPRPVAPVLQPPQKPGGMADKNIAVARRGQVRRSEIAEIDARLLVSRETVGEGVPHFRAERPAMDENEPHAAAPAEYRDANSPRAAISASMSSGWWAEHSEMRSRLDPCGTVGGQIAGTRKPRRSSSADTWRASASAPISSGMIWLALSPQFQPCAVRLFRNLSACPSRRARSPDICGTRVSAASIAPSTEGGRPVL